jgi:two-component system, chemotaxis family, CheB/CheR fusion protein
MTVLVKSCKWKYDFKGIFVIQIKTDMISDQMPKYSEEQLSLSFIASHDLQEPLRKIALFTSMIAEDQESQLSGESAAYLDRIIIAVKRMQLLTENLLEYSNLDNSDRTNNEFQAIDLNQLINEVIENVSEAIVTTNAIISISELPTINANPLLISRLFTNLLNNALLYVHPESSPNITISACIVIKDNLEYNKIDVTDLGVGFTQEQASEIFEPLRRLHSKDKYDGSGMGLAICKKIIQMHNGFITAQGVQEEGAVFSVLLPVMA